MTLMELWVLIAEAAEGPHGSVLSLLLLAELFLNSLSQPYSLEEQEQMLSCLSIDSPFVSDASEKVSSKGCQGWG